MEVTCALSTFRCFAGLRRLRRHFQQQLQNDRIENNAILHDRESYGCTPGEQPDFYLLGSDYR